MPLARGGASPDASLSGTDGPGPSERSKPPGCSLISAALLGRIPPARPRRSAASPAIPQPRSRPAFRRRASSGPGKHGPRALDPPTPETARLSCGGFPCFTLSPCRVPIRGGAFPGVCAPWDCEGKRRVPARRSAFPDAPSAGPAAPRPPEGGSAARSFQPPTVRPFPHAPAASPRRGFAVPPLCPLSLRPLSRPAFRRRLASPRPGKTRPARPWPSPRPRPSATHAGASLVSRFPSAAPPPAAARFPTPSVRLPRRLPVDPRARAGYNRCAAARGRADARHLKEE